MQIKNGKLAIIAGGGDLVLSSIKSCKTQNSNMTDNPTVRPGEGSNARF